MSLEAFIYADNPLSSIASSVNLLLVTANNRIEADALVALAVSSATSQLTNYPNASGTVQKFQYLDSSFNKVATLANIDALAEGPGYPVDIPGVAYEFQITVGV